MFNKIPLHYYVISMLDVNLKKYIKRTKELHHVKCIIKQTSMLLKIKIHKSIVKYKNTKDIFIIYDDFGN
jgi:hypothetical protein